MTIIRNRAVDPGGHPLPGVIVVAELVAGSQAGYTTDGTVLHRVATTAGDDGRWELDLIPNAQITPAGSHYRISERTQVTMYVHTAVVPAGDPVRLYDVLAVPPPPTTPLTPVFGSGEVSSVDGRKGAVDLSDRYAALDHRHDGLYSGLAHEHDGRYSGLAHTHTEYSPTGHLHDSRYAPLAHEHDQHNDARYAPTGHGHDAAAITTGRLDLARLPAAVALGTDPRFTDPRQPVPHASTHLTAGADPVLLGQDQVTGLTGVLAAKADLVGGLIPTAQLPALALTEVSVVGSQAEMLGLTAQRGDVAIRTDQGRTYILASDVPGSLADWKEVTAIGTVRAINGQQGIVVLSAADVGAVPLARTITTTGPLTGGGDLSGNRTLGLIVGSAPGSVAAGDDPRFAAALQRAANLSDLTNPAAARTALGVAAGQPGAVGTKPGRWAVIGTPAPQGSTKALVVGIGYGLPFAVHTARSYDRISVEITAGSAIGSGGTLRAVLLGTDVDYHLGTVITDHGPVPSESAGGLTATWTVNQPVTPGVYVLAIHCQVAACTVRALGNGWNPLVTVESFPAGANAVLAYNLSPASTISAYDNSAPKVGIRWMA